MKDSYIVLSTSTYDRTLTLPADMSLSSESFNDP